MLGSLRRQFRRVAAAVRLGGNILLLAPAATAYTLFHRVRSFRHAGTSTELPRINADDADLPTVMRSKKPVIIEGLMQRLDVRVKPDLATLRQVAQTAGGKFDVRFFDKASPYFLYTGDYGLTLDHSSAMSLHSFLKMMFDPASEGQYCVYHQFGRNALEGAAGSIIDDVAEKLAGIVALPAEKSVSGIWIGSRGVVTPLHCDAWPGLLFQTHGSKRVAMFSPGDAANLYLKSPFAIGDRWSDLPGRTLDAPADAFPRLSRTTRYDATLGSGDTLFIPPFWAHEMEALEANISMPFRFKVEASGYLHPLCLRALSELFHRSYMAPRATS
jgi:hypothetical protein